MWTERLTEVCNYDHPLEALRQISTWAETPEIAKIMDEARTFEFNQENIVVRVLIHQFVEFCSDKLEHPHFFCWPGAFLSGPRADETTKRLFVRHLSLFGDHADGIGVYPRERQGVPADNLVSTLTNFYGHIVLFDLTRQLIINDGPFELSYDWLSDTYSTAEVEEAVKRIFKSVYGMNLDDFEV